MPLTNNTPRPAGNVLVAGQGVTNEDRLAPTSVYIGAYMQEQYNWTNDTPFYTASPSYLKPFYRKVKNWERWMNGIVPNFHNLQQGLVPTHLSRFIVDRISDLIVGDGVTLGLYGEGVDKTIPNDSLKKAGEWAERVNLNERIQTLTNFATGLGTACLKLNQDDDGELWLEAVPMNRMRYTYDGAGNPIEGTFQIEVYFRNDTKDTDTYGLFERRFIEGGKPYSVYTFYRVSAQANQNNDASGFVHLEPLQVPHDVWERFREEFGDMRLDEPVMMPWVKGIGVYAYRFTDCVKSMPHLRYGDSVLEGLNDYLCKYDILSAITDTEMYCGRARVLANKKARNPSLLQQNSGIDNFLVTAVETDTTEGQPLTFIQPNIRTTDLVGLRNALLEDIAVAIKITPSSFAPFLNNSQQYVSARQVSTEESQTTLFVSNKRKGLAKCINSMMDDVRRFYGLTDGVHAEFSIAGQSNYSVTVENTARKFQSGLMSLDSAVRAVNPGMDEMQLAKEIAQIKKEQAEKQTAMSNSLWGNLDNGTDVVEN